MRNALVIGAVMSSLAHSLVAEVQQEQVVRALASAERQQIEDLQAMALPLLRDAQQAMSAQQIEARAAELYALGSPSIGERAVDEEGYAAIHRYLREFFAELAPEGMEYVGALETRAFAPVELPNRRDPEAVRSEETRLEVAGEEIPLSPFYPNGAMPSLAPEGGLTGPLVYVQRANWADLSGLNLDGAIALLDFGGAGNVERLFELGAQAVVVLEDSFVSNIAAEDLVVHTPFPYPRFYATAEQREQLLALATRTTPDGLQTGETGTIYGGNLYEARTVRTMVGYLPPTDPLRFRIEPMTLLRWIGADYGVGGTELQEANELSSPVLSPGQTILIPGGRGEYVVRENDLWERLGRRFGVASADLREANPAAELPLRPGAEILIPNREGPLTLIAPIDGNSVVPGQPHGAYVYSNLALLLETVRFVSTHEDVVRRRGMMVLLTDGDSLGGVASRLFAEYVMLGEGKLGLAFAEDAQGVIARYEDARAFFDGDPARIEAEDSRQWLVEEWLWEKLESARIDIATERIPLRVELADGGQEVEKRAEKEARLEVLNEELRALVELRDRTIGGEGSFIEQLDRLLAQWNDPAVQDFVEGRNIDSATLRRRFNRELDQEVTREDFHANNQRVTAAILDLLNPRREEGVRNYRLGYYFDFSDESFTAKLVSGESPQGLRSSLKIAESSQRSIGTRFQNVLAVASLRAGWTEEYVFITEKDQASFPSIEQKVPAVYDEFWVEGGLAIIVPGTANARHEKIDTPWDTLERTDFKNLAVQGRSILVATMVALESANDAEVGQNINRADLSRVVGQIAEFNIRSGIDANAPVPDAYVYFPAIPNESSQLDNSFLHRGVRRGILKKSFLNGSYRMPVENATYNNKPRVYAYMLDERQALFTKVANEGQVGTQAQTAAFTFVAGEDVEKKIVMSELYPRVIFPGIDPHEYRQLGGYQRAANDVQLIDAVRDGEPRNQAQDNPFTDYREKDLAGIVIYGEPGTRMRAIIQRGIEYKMLLVGELVREDKGSGYLIGPTEDGGRNLYLANTPLHVADDMVALARYRLDLYREFGITSQPLEAAVSRAEEKLAEAQAAAAGERWQEAVGLARESWGILMKHYSRVLKLGRESVFSVILVMALLVPAAFFLERLVIGSRGVMMQLSGTAGLFAAGTLLLNFFHPAFRIALSPFIVVIAFVMILMSVIVLSICYQRFEVLVRRARMEGGEIESEEISLMSSLSTALSLGVSNLRKRMARTVLTTLTVTVLTFSIVAFVAVTGGDQLVEERRTLDTFIDGEQVEPDTPNYEGILFRKFNWQQMAAADVSAKRTEFGSRYPVSVRAHYIEQEGGNQADREGVNQIPVSYQGEMGVVTGVMAFEPIERQFSGLHQAVSHEAWFRGSERTQDGIEPPDRDVVILPDRIAQTLGITPGMLVDQDGQRLPHESLPEVTMSGRPWRVIGILDTEEANRYRDVNGESLAMVDYLRSAMNKNVSGQLEEEGESYHLSWEDLAIIPFEAYQDVDARIRSVAVKVPEGKDATPFFNDLRLRLKDPLFAYSDGQLSFLRTRQSADIGGVAKIILPVVLCILIVMNTMMGTVDERRGEVGMLGAIGLSPRQIAFLLLSEATVYSILGIVFGILGGLLFANFVPWINAQGIAFLGDLSFNFTSLTSMLLALGTGLIVLIATLIPASKAAKMAAPSGMSRWQLPAPEPGEGIRFALPFTLTRGNAIGMLAFFRQFLLNHTEPTSADFNCRDIAVRPVEDGTGAAEVYCRMWLSPYDLDVAQEFRMQVAPSSEEGIFEVTILLERLSGSEENWLRTNYQFLNLVRKQFLVWRNLKAELRVRYIETGAEIVKEKLIPAQTSS